MSSAGALDLSRKESGNNRATRWLNKKFCSTEDERHGFSNLLITDYDDLIYIFLSNLESQISSHRCGQAVSYGGDTV